MYTADTLSVAMFCENVVIISKENLYEISTFSGLYVNVCTRISNQTCVKLFYEHTFSIRVIVSLSSPLLVEGESRIGKKKIFFSSLAK